MNIVDMAQVFAAYVAAGYFGYCLTRGRSDILIDEEAGEAPEERDPDNGGERPFEGGANGNG